MATNFPLSINPFISHIHLFNSFNTSKCPPPQGKVPPWGHFDLEGGKIEWHEASLIISPSFRLPIRWTWATLLLDILILDSLLADHFNGGKRVCSSWSWSPKDWYNVYKVITYIYTQGNQSDIQTIKIIDLFDLRKFEDINAV